MTKNKLQEHQYWYYNTCLDPAGHHTGENEIERLPSNNPCIGVIGVKHANALLSIPFY
jgi:hypothetical protein